MQMISLHAKQLIDIVNLFIIAFLKFDTTESYLLKLTSPIWEYKIYFKFILAKT